LWSNTTSVGAAFPLALSILSAHVDGSFLT